MQTEEALAAEFKRALLEKDAVKKQLEFAAEMHLLAKERDDALQRLHAVSETQRESQSAISHLQERIQQERARGNAAAAQAAQQRLSICQRAIKRMLMQHVAQSWSAFVEGFKDARTRRQRLQRVVNLMQHRGLAAAWLTLRDRVAEQVAMKVTLSRVASRMKNALVFKLLHTWAETAAEASRVKHILRRIALRIKNAAVSQSLLTWRDATCNRVRERRVVASALSRVQRRGLAAAWLTLRDRVAEQVAMKVTLSRVASRMKNALVFKLLHRWAETAAEASRVKHILRRIALRIKNAAVSQSLLTWYEAAGNQARIRQVVLRAAGRSQRGCVEEAWAQWLESLDAQRRSELEHRQQETAMRAEGERQRLAALAVTRLRQSRSRNLLAHALLVLVHRQLAVAGTTETGGAAQELQARAIARARDLASSLASPVASEVATGDQEEPPPPPSVGNPTRRNPKTADMYVELMQLRATLGEEAQRSARLQEQVVELQQIQQELTDQHVSETAVLRQELHAVLQDLEAEGHAYREAEILGELEVAKEACRRAEAAQTALAVDAAAREEENAKLRDEIARLEEEMEQMQLLHVRETEEGQASEREVGGGLDDAGEDAGASDSETATSNEARVVALQEEKKKLEDKVEMLEVHKAEILEVHAMRMKAEAEGHAHREAEILGELEVAKEACRRAEAAQAALAVDAAAREEESAKLRDEIARMEKETKQMQQLLLLQQQARTRAAAQPTNPAPAAADNGAEEAGALRAQLKSAVEAKESLANLLRLREDDLDSLNRTVALYAQSFAAASFSSADVLSQSSPSASSSSSPPHSPLPSEGEEQPGSAAGRAPAAGEKAQYDVASGQGMDAGVSGLGGGEAGEVKEARDAAGRQEELGRRGTGANEQGRRGLEQLERLCGKLRSRVVKLSADKEQLLMRIASLERVSAAPGVSAAEFKGGEEEDEGSRARGFGSRA